MYLYGYSRFKLKGQCRSEKWEVYLYGDSRFKLKGQCRIEKWEVYLYGYSRFKLKGQCRSEKWEVYLYGDSRFKLKGQCRSEKWEVYLFAGVEQGAYGGVYGVSAVEGVLGPFSRSSGRPGVSASFSSPRALTPVSARGLLPISF